MTSKVQQSLPGKRVAFNGARIAIAGVFAYSFLVMMYTITRTSITIRESMQGTERAAILWANGFSIAYSVAVFSILMALVSLVLGAITSIGLKHALMYFNPGCNFGKALLITGITGFFVLVVIYIALYWLLGKWMSFQYIETFAFWFLLPATLYSAATLAGGVFLNKELRKYPPG